MSHSSKRRSRREFFRDLGSTAGALALAGPLARVRTTSAFAATVFPELSQRARGWLRFLWDKATTNDDWSSRGRPHEWWDQYTAPGVLSYPRFDLHESTYAIVMMADQTPAWREAYTRIVDELAGRYPTYWGAIDWLTQIGDDPQRDQYPAAMLDALPARLRGKYNRIGWTANGVAPWGLQPDPIGADGNLFFRGWFNLVLSVYKYVSGDDKWERPFKVTGYQDREFEWDQQRLVEHLEAQWSGRPEGIHCENTKIWPICLSSAGLGLYLYDRLSGKNSHRVYENWLEYCKQHYTGVGNDGKLKWFTGYYDPIARYKANTGPAGAVIAAFYILPQNRKFAAFLYEAAANEAGWNNPRAPVQSSALGLILARELGDHTAVARLSAAAEREFEPRFFGDRDERFGWWFALGEKYPRGQMSALMMVSEVGQGGDWIRAFQTPHADKFQAPTVSGVDFPALGICQAWNDRHSGTLHVGTYPASPDRRGLKTTWRISGLPNVDDVVVLCDGQPFRQIETVGPGTIRIDTTIETRRFQIYTGYRGTAEPEPREGVRARPDQPGQRARGFVTQAAVVGDDSGGGQSATLLASLGGASCPCCRLAGL